jgi:hypothetical protein
LAPVTSSRPDDWTWITARWMTRWKPDVGFLVDIVAYRAAQLVDIDIARAHDRRSIGILDQRQQQMLKRGILVMPLIGIGQRLMDRLFETV